MLPIKVYVRLRGKVICYMAQTDDHVKAIDAVARRFNELENLSGCSSEHMNMKLSATRWSFGPFLALVPKPATTT